MASMRNRVRAGVLLTLAMVVTLVLVLTHATPALSQGTSTVGVSNLDEPAAGHTSMVGYTSTFHAEDSAVSFCNGYSNTDSYGFSVDENTSENTVVGTVAACEPHGDSLTYFVGGTDVAKFNEVFDLNASTGEITVKSGASIDYEGGKRSYSLTVTVTDAEDSSDATVPMSITVINVDEPGTVTLSQATPGVGSALRPTLDDPDGWVVLFKVQWSRADTADGPFTVLNFRYISSLRKASYTPETADEGKFLKVTLFYIDRQCRVVNSYNNQCRRMAAKTADNAVATAGTNTAPVFSSSNVSRSIAENTAAGQNVGTAVTATDADAGDTLGYTLGGADAASFDFVESSGQIRTKSGVTYDFEAKSSYTVTVTASDGTDTAVATVTISVTDVDEPPSAPATPMVSAVSGSTTSLSVSWAAPANAGKPAIASYDVQYRVGSSGAWSDGPEDVAGTSTTITSLVASTDYEARVRATNAEGDSGWSDPPGAGRTNTPTNNAPVFSSSNVSRSIAENTAAGQNVGAAVTATDADAGDTLGYTLGGADAASFDFVESSGQIRTKSGVTYDFEAKSSYTVTVTASDGTDTAVATVTISVTDVDEPPSAPATPMVSAVSGSTTSLSVSWAAPANAGKPAIASYDVQYRVGSSGAWSDGPEDVAGTSTTITSLVASTDYEARVRATNAEGDSGWSDPPGAGRTNFLVGNFGQTVDGAAVITLVRDIVGAFTAGALGAELHNIEFRLFVQLRDIDSAQLPSVTLYRGSVLRTRATTGTLVATLSAAPGSSRPSDTVQTVAFIAPGGTRLDADTTYLVVLTGEGSVRVEATTSPAEDAGGASGWTIDGVGAGSSSPYSYQTTPSLRMRVNGTAGAPATGVPGITGTALVGKTLTATTDGIEDEDGLTGATFTYQWLVDGAEINGATDSTYIVIAADEGKPIEVRVAFTDDAGNPESLTSYPFLFAPPLIIRDVPVIASNTPATGAPTITGTVRGGETLTANTTDIADSDGLNNATFTYQWLADDTDITDATGSTHALAAADEGKTVKVRITFTDDRGHQETLTSTATAAVASAPSPLTATVHSAPASHDGSDSFTFELRFSEAPKDDFSYKTLRDHAFTETGYDVTGARRLKAGKNLNWVITVDPSGNSDVTVELPATTDCADQGAICTSDDRKLFSALEFIVPHNWTPTGAPTITGTVRVGGTLTANTTGIADSDGLNNATFTYQWLADDTDITDATGSTYTLAAADEGKTVKVRLSFTDDRGHQETLTSTATAAVASAPSPMTAAAHDVPASHDGSDSFTFELRFSETPKDGFSYKTLRDNAFTETGGDVTGARRLKAGKNLNWVITVQPSGNADVTLTLPATTDCAAQGAICTAGGQALSSPLEIRVSGPGG